MCSAGSQKDPGDMIQKAWDKQPATWVTHRLRSQQEAEGSARASFMGADQMLQVKHLGARAMVFEGNEWTGQK